MDLSTHDLTAIIAGNIAAALLINPNTIKMGKDKCEADEEDEVAITDTTHQEWIAECAVDQAKLIMQELK